VGPLAQKKQESTGPQTNYLKARQNLQKLKKGGWIGQSTKAVFILADFGTIYK
jgi:hypothetical protein